MTDLVSVIVPAYNAEKYLQRCLESIQKQTYSHLEIIVIDDGSTDETLTVAKSFEADQRFRIIHQHNQGIGVTRNHGVDLATGEYLCFVDSDDYVEPMYVQQLYESITQNQSELSWCDFYREEKTGQAVVAQRERDLLRFEFPCLWNKMFKTELFRINRIQFPDAWYEDLATVPRLLLTSKKRSYVNRALYHYCKNDASITTTFSSKVSDMYLVLNVLDEFFKNRSDSRALFDYILVFHGLCGTVFRMMMSKEHSVKEIQTFYSRIVKMLEGKRINSQIFFYLPFNYKLFYLSIWGWSIPMMRNLIVYLKK